METIAGVVAGFEDLNLRRLIGSVLLTNGAVDTVNILLYLHFRGISTLPTKVYRFFKNFSETRKEKFLISNLCLEYREKSLETFLNDFRQNIEEWFGAVIEVDSSKLIRETKKDYREFIKNRLIEPIDTEEKLIPGRSYEAYYNQLLRFLKDRKTAVLLLGKAGSGKTALVKLLSKNIEKTYLKDYSVGSIELDSDLINKLKVLSTENFIVFIDEAHRLDKELIQDLKPLISESELKLILATTTDEAGDLLRDEAFRRRLKILNVEPCKEDVKTVMSEKYRELKEETVSKIVSFAVNFSNNESPMSLSDKMLREFLSEGNLSEVIYNYLKVNPEVVNNPDFERIYSYLKERILFQEKAIEKIAKWLAAYLSGFRRNKPLTFLFTGPTGTGKTLTAEVIAELIKGDREQLHVINMANYQLEADVWRLLGSARGFVGSEEESVLRKIYRNDPFPVILFDEIEKANPRIWQAFLSLTDKGKIEDNHGILNFQNAVIIFTSNATAEYRSAGFLGRNSSVESKLTSTFQPEFVARLINIEFQSIGKDNAFQLIEKKLDELLQNYELNKNRELRENILKKLQDIEYKGLGVREMERIIEEELIEFLINSSGGENER